MNYSYQHPTNVALSVLIYHAPARASSVNPLLTEVV